ncbi:MAG: biopolymer transporter ExbD [Halobacteriovoraceae bacterium]|nr:biopolymer transporter ExbD [Halobacteriovoraceae bacterium]
MLRVPSRRKKKGPPGKVNLIPILDAIFIFIFFLLLSSSFLNVFEISSPLPLASEAEPPPSKVKKKPLNLTLKITQNALKIYTGLPGRLTKTFSSDPNNGYPLNDLRLYLIDLKGRHLKEKTIILEPQIDIKYNDLVKIMDAVRILKKTDPSFYRQGEDGVDEKVNELFDDIMFGNIQS